MSEGELIEIAQRRRFLEDAIDALNPASDFVDDDICDDQTAQSYLTECAEACRDDMNRLMEEVRKAAK